jgi:phosphoribosylaminoimidazole-succinocarboxamide synthase
MGCMLLPLTISQFYSYDKQFVRDYLLSIKFDKKTPIELPTHIIQQTRRIYLEIFHKLTDHQPDFIFPLPQD